MVAPLAMLGLSAVGNMAGGILDALGGGAGAAAKGRAGQPSAAAGKLKQTADEFEKLFLEDTLERMTAGTGDEGPLGEGGAGGSVYRSMLVKEYAAGIAKSGGVGISGQVYRQLLQLQEGA